MRCAAMARLVRNVVLACLLALVSWTAPALAQEQSVAAPTPATAVPASGAPAASILEVRYENNLLSVTAARADLAALLKKVSEATGIAVEMGPDVTGTVSLSFSALKLEEGIIRILDVADSKNYAATFEKVGQEEKDFRLRKILVVRKGAGETSAAPAVSASDFPRTAEGVQAYLKKRYGRVVEIKRAHWKPGYQRLERLAYYDEGFSKRVGPENIRAFADDLLAGLAPFFGVDTAQLGVPTVTDNKEYINIRYPQSIGGVGVEEAGVSVEVLKEEMGFGETGLVKVSAAYYPGITLSTEPKLTAAEATVIADGLLRSSLSNYAQQPPSEVTPLRPPKLLIFPERMTPAGSGYRYRLVWRIDYRLRREVRVDAYTGEIVTEGGGPVPNTLQANIYGKREADGKYAEGKQADGTLSKSVGQLQVLNLWKTSGYQLLPNIPDRTDVNGTFTPAEGFFPAVMKVDGPEFLEGGTRVPGIRVFHDGDPGSPDYDKEEYSRDLNPSDFDQNGALILGTEVSDELNVFHQLRRALIDYFSAQGIGVEGVPEVGGGLGTIEVKTNYKASDMDDPDTIGDAAAGVIRLRDQAERSSDVILHEISHLAVESTHGGPVWDPLAPDELKKLSSGVSEGLANYFACRINKDSEYDWANGATYDLSVSHALKDRNGDHVTGAMDWQHYDNGRVLASILWDLTKETTPNHTTDQKIWLALRPAPDGISGFRPEDLYVALESNDADPNLLWATFSAHEVNLEAVPHKELPGIVTGIDLDWFPHFGSSEAGYVVERAEVGGSYASVMTLAETAWQDTTIDAGKTYKYRVCPQSGGTCSNEAVVTADSVQVPSVKISKLEVYYQDGKSEGWVDVHWEVTDPSGMLATVHLTVSNPAGDTVLDKDVQDLPFERLSSLSDGVVYTVHMTATDQSGRTSFPDVRTIVAINNSAPPVPGPLEKREYASQGVMGLGWTATKPADLEGFRVYYRQGSWPGPYDGSALKWCCPVAGGPSCVDAASNFVEAEFVAAPSPIDVGLNQLCYFMAPGVSTYYLAVSAYDTAFEPWGNESEPSAPVAFFDSTKPASPTRLEVTSGGGVVELCWSPPADGDVAGYRIYRKEVGVEAVCASPDLEELFGVDKYCQVAKDVTETCWEDSGADPAKAYTYIVLAEDYAGNLSEPASYWPPLDVALVLDRSGSMQGDRIGHATRAAGMFVDILGVRNKYRGGIANQHRAGIFSFGESATSMRGYTGVSWPSWAQADELVAVNAETVTSFQDVLNKVMNEVNANPQWTNMISGLEAARLALDEGLDGIANENGRGDRIFLLSDGDHNYYRCKSRYSMGGDEQGTAVDGPNFYVSGALTVGELCPAPPTECPRPTVACPGAGQLFPTGVGISTVSLGGDISENGRQVLVNLAANTGGSGGQPGEWYDVSVSDFQTTLDLEKVYIKMLMQATGGVNVESIDDDLGPNETQRLLVSVDSSMREATFIVTWANDEVPVELVLHSPDGSYIDPIAAATGQGMEFVAGRGYQFYHVIEPRAGPWEMVVTAAATTPYSAMLIGESLLKMALDFDRLAYVANDPITLSVKIFQPDGTLIPGAQVGGFVQTPSQINEITLNDLGQLGDPVASDGVYTAIYNGAAAQGAYTFSLRAAGLTTAGEAFSREDLHSIYVASTSGPEAPRMLTATGGAGYVDLSWINPMSMNLEAVRIMRSTAGYPNNINEGQMVYDGLSVPFRDLDVVNGTTYYYAAFARNTNQEYSLPATDARAVATPNAIDTEPPQPIRDFVAIPGNNSVALYWSNPLNTDFAHVRILRTAGACAGSCSDPSATVFEPPPEATSFTDTTAANGITYCYAIFAVDTSGNCSGAGTSSSGTATPTAPVTPPAVNDPLFSMQWHLHNEGQTGGKVDADMDAPEAWQIEQGSNQVVIAIVDTGVDYNHPDLAFNIWKNYPEIPGNGLDDDGNGYVDDYYGYDFTGARDSDPKDDFGHGTHCAGIADAVTNNGIGVAGVARQAKIQSVKVLDAGGSGYWEWVAAGIIYAADNGADVISMSLGGPHSKLVEDACNYARDKGVVVVAAAGNSATSAKSYPGGYESVIGVSATDHNDKLAWFSNFGDWVDVSAPGVNVYATMPTYPVTMNIWGYTPNYSNMSGTSMACPNVAGLAALILARYPDLTNEQVREALRNTGDDLGTPGFDPYFGYGRVNAANAMRMDKVGPLEVSKWRIEDDALSPSRGNGDKVINPGERVEMFLSVKNRGGQNAGAVTALLSTTDPYVIWLDATPVSFVSVPRWGVSESLAPVVFEMAADTPVPHFIPFHAVLTDEQGGRWELDFEVSVGIYGPSLRIAETIIDDDNSQESKGNGDGIVNVGEVIELRVRLRNDGDQPASGVQAQLSTRDPYIILTDNSEDYGSIPAGGSAFCQFDYDFRVSDNCPDGHEVTLDLQITDNEGRVWADTITFPVFLPPPEVRYQSNTIVADYRGPPPGSGQLGEGDRAVSPGETVELEILLSSHSPATATGVTAVLTSADPLIAVHSGAVEYGDLLGSAGGVRGKTRHSFTVDANHAVGGNLSFTLTVSDGGGLSWTDTFTLHVFGLSTVAGQVRDASGSGLSDARVEYTGKLIDNRTVSGSATTGADGRYLLEGILDGAYTVTATKVGYLLGQTAVALPPSASGVDFVLERGGFTDVTVLAGVGAGYSSYAAALADYDNDGDLDIFVPRFGQPGILYRNNADGTYTEVSAEAGVNVADNASAAIFADVDNDGDQDLFLANWNMPHRLYENLGNGTFKDSSRDAGFLAAAGYGNGATAADVDGDGDLDIFVPNYGQADRLFVNDGKGVFTDGTAAAGLGDEGQATGAVFADFDGDGDQDLFVTRTNSSPAVSCLLYINDGHGVFADGTGASGLGAQGRWFGSAFLDYDGDGDRDLFVAEGRSGTSRLYRNDGAGTFTDVTAAAFPAGIGLSEGVLAADLSADGWDDLFLTGGATSIFYRNLGDGSFAEDSSRFKIGGTAKASGAAGGDLDGDGDLDLYVSRYAGASLFVNDTDLGNHLAVRVVGTSAPRDGVGTLVEVYPAGQIGEPAQLLARREVRIAGGASSPTELKQTFHLTAGNAYDLRAVFPGGFAAQAAGITAPAAITLVEPGLAPPVRFTAGLGSGRLLLSWVLPSDPNVAGVRVVRKETQNPPAPLCQRGDEGTCYPLDPSDGAVVYEGGGTAWVDEGLTNDTVTYYYTAFSFNAAMDVWSRSVDQARDHNTPDGTAPLTPVGLKLYPGDSVADALWQANAESDLAGYNIYVDGIKRNQELITSKPPQSPFAEEGGVERYVVEQLINGTTYTFTLTAVDKVGNESLPCAALTLLVEPDVTPPVVAIASPADKSRVEGTILVSGTVEDPYLTGYKLSVNAGLYHSRLVLAQGAASVTGGALGTWDSSVAEDGVYSLLLEAWDYRGNRSSTFIGVSKGDARYLLSFGTSGSEPGRLRGPADVDVALAGDAIGRISVADSNNHRIQVFDASGNYLSQFGTFGSANAQISTPASLALLPDGSTAVAESGNHRIQILNAGGYYVNKFGSLGVNAGQFDSPRGINRDGAGRYLVADTNNHRIQILSSTGAPVLQFGSKGYGPGQFSYPRAVAADAFGNLFVADGGNDRVQVFDATGTYLYAFGATGSGDGQFRTPAGLAIDAQGNVYVTDMNNHRVQRFNADGRYLAKFGYPGRTIGEFSSPQGLALNAAGDLVVADTGNDRIQVFHFDETPPAAALAQIRSPQDQSMLRGSALIVGTAYAPAGQFVSYKVLSENVTTPGVWTTIQTSTTPVFNGTLASWNVQALADGQYRLKVELTTSGGTVEEIVNVSLDQHAPTVAITQPVNLDLLALDTDVLGTASDQNLVSYTLEIGKSAVQDSWKKIAEGQSAIDNGYLGRVTLAGLEDGTYSLRLTALDSAGNTGTAAVVFSKGEAQYLGAYQGTSLFSSALDVDVDTSNQTYVLDQAARQVVVLDAAGAFVRAFGGAQLGSPVALDVGNSRVYVLDGEVKVFYSSGTYQGTLGGTGAGGPLNKAQGLAVDSRGYVSVADTYNHRVVVYDGSGNFIRAIGGFGTDIREFNEPRDVAVDTSNNLFVADTGNQRIQVFNKDGDYITNFGQMGPGTGQFQFPRDLTLDADGVITVLDSSCRVQKFNAAGEFLASFGESGAGEGQLSSPQGLAYAPNGELLVADWGNQRVQRFRVMVPPSPSPVRIADITWPRSGEDLRGGTFLVGWASGPEFDRYNVEYSTPSNPTYWAPLASAVRNPVEQGTLVSFDIRNIYSQSFTLRLSVYYTDGTVLTDTLEVTKDQVPPLAEITAPAWAHHAAMGDVVQFDGSARDYYVNAIARYRLEYGNPDYPYQSQWTLIAESPLPVADGVLGVWDTANVPDGVHTVRLTVTDLAGLTSTDTVLVSVGGIQFLGAVTTLGQSGRTLNSPGDVAFSGPDRLYIVERSPAEVLRLSGDFDYLGNFGVAGPGPGQITSPGFAAVGGDGTVYVTDEYYSGAKGALAYDGEGSFIRNIGEGPESKNISPMGVAVSGNRVAVVGSRVGRVNVYDTAGAHVLSYGAYGYDADRPAYSLSGAAMDRFGNIIVGDYRRVLIHDPQGRFMFGFGTNEEVPFGFSRIRDVAVDDLGNILVLSNTSGYPRVHKFTFDETSPARGSGAGAERYLTA